MHLIVKGVIYRLHLDDLVSFAFSLEWALPCLQLAVQEMLADVRRVGAARGNTAESHRAEDSTCWELRLVSELTSCCVLGRGFGSTNLDSKWMDASCTERNVWLLASRFS